MAINGPVCTPNIYKPAANLMCHLVQAVESFLKLKAAAGFGHKDIVYTLSFDAFLYYSHRGDYEINYACYCKNIIQVGVMVSHMTDAHLICLK